MKSDRWTFIFASPASNRNFSIRIPPMAIVLIVILGIMSSAGLINLLRIGIGYGYANFYVKKQEKLNHQATLKLQFLEKLAEQQKNEIKRLTRFEDNVRSKYGMNSISEDVRKAGIGGKPNPEDLIIESFGDPVVKKARHIEKEYESLNRQVQVLSSTFARMNEYTRRIIDVQAQRPSIWPARGRITSRFGPRFHPLFKKYMFHEGLDIANTLWSPIFSSAAGIVTNVGKNRELGNVVKITHAGSGYSTRYAHLIQSAVVEGQVVNRGDIIGYMGNTGRSTGSHLHYEVIKDGRAVDPLTFILPQDIIVD